MSDERCQICGNKIELDEIACELGWTDVTLSLICARCAKGLVDDEREEEQPRLH